MYFYSLIFYLISFTRTASHSNLLSILFQIMIKAKKKIPIVGLMPCLLPYHRSFHPKLRPIRLFYWQKRASPQQQWDKIKEHSSPQSQVSHFLINWTLTQQQHTRWLLMKLILCKIGLKDTNLSSYNSSKSIRSK